MKNLTFALCFTLSQLLFAAAQPASSTNPINIKAKIHAAADEYFSNKNNISSVQPFYSLLPNHFPPPHPPANDCLPPSSGPSCSDIACEKLGWAGCNDIDEIKSVGNACRGNRDGDCLKTACDLLGWAGCNDMSEIQEVGKACAGNYDSSCLASSCEKLGWAGCNDSSEIATVGAACKGVYGRQCIDQICEKVGSSGCNDLTEIVEVAKVCGGAH